MRSRNHRLRRGLALATVVSALAAPTAWAAPIDPVGPVTSEGQQGTSIDQREGSALPHGVDYSSMDQEPYVGSVTALSPPSDFDRATEPSTVSGDGFDWGDAGIGAAGVFALAAIAGGAAIATGYRMGRHTVA